MTTQPQSDVVTLSGVTQRLAEAGAFVERSLCPPVTIHCTLVIRDRAGMIVVDKAGDVPHADLLSYCLRGGVVVMHSMPLPEFVRKTFETYCEGALPSFERHVRVAHVTDTLDDHTRLIRMVVVLQGRFACRAQTGVVSHVDSGLGRDYNRGIPFPLKTIHNKDKLPDDRRLVDAVAFCMILRSSPHAHGREIVIVTEVKRDGETLAPGLLFLPAGHIELFETAIEGAVRETMEEASADVHGPRCVLTHLAAYFYSQNKGYSPLHFVFVGEVPADFRLKEVPDRESWRADWMPLDDVYRDCKQLAPAYRNPREMRCLLTLALENKESWIPLSYRRS